MPALIVLGVSILLARVAGYAGVEAVASWAASTRVGMAVMLFFHAARTAVTLRGRPVTPLWLRAPKLLFMGLIAWSGLVARR